MYHKFKEKAAFINAEAKTVNLRGNKNYDRFVELLGARGIKDGSAMQIERKLLALTEKQLIAIFKIVAEI